MSSIFTWPETTCTCTYLYSVWPARSWQHYNCTVGSLLNVSFPYRLQFLFIFSFMSISTFTRYPGMDTSWIYCVTNTKLSFMSVIQLLSVKRHVAFLASPSHFPRLNNVIACKKSYPADSCEGRSVSITLTYAMLIICQVLEISWKSLINSIGTVNYSRHVEIKIHSSPRNSESNGILSHFVVFSGKTNLDLPVFSTRFVIQTPPAGVVISGVCCLNPVLKSAWPSACLSRKVTQQLQLQNKRLLVAEFFICDFRMKSPYSYFALYAWCIGLISQETLVKANQYDPHLFPSEGPFIEGWYSRIIDFESNHSFGILFGQVLLQSHGPHFNYYPQNMLSFIHSKGDGSSMESFAVYPSNDDIEVTVRGKPVTSNPDFKSPANFEWKVKPYGYFRVTENETRFNFTNVGVSLLLECWGPQNHGA